MKISGVFFVRVVLLSSLLLIATRGFAQDQNGALRGVVFDPQGRVVSDAMVSATNENTGLLITSRTSTAGVYIFPALLVGSYGLRVEAPGFAAYVRTGIQVFAAQVAEATATLALGATTTQVRVQSGADVVQAESSQLSGSFQGRSISEIPIVPGPNRSVLNLSIYLPNTTTAPAGPEGAGGAIGGLRGRQNGFSIDGVDNNDPTATTASQPVIPDAVQQFTVNQNIFSAEYGRGSGGQFNVITKTGTNRLHFGTWLYNMNRAYNAADNQEHDDIAKGVRTDKRRFDFNRVGGDIGGPVIAGRLFLYGAYEFNNLGKQATAPSGLAPTSSGMGALNTLAVDSQVRGLLAQFPVAPVQNACLPLPARPCVVTVNAQQIPVGTVTSVSPQFATQHDYIINGDLNPDRQTLHVRYLVDRNRQPFFGAFPQTQFASFAAQDSHRVIVNHVWMATPRLVNEFQASFARYNQFFPLNGIAENYPNLTMNDLALSIGPNSGLPSHRLFNEYLLGDTVTWTMGRHSLKAGGQYVWFTAPAEFLSSQRGAYTYTSLSQLINDQVPASGTQGIGNGYFAGNSEAFSLFAQDDIKLTPRLTLNLGLRYDFFGNPADTKLNGLNSIADLPGTPLVFKTPKQDWNNVGPRLGFAWDPTGSGKWGVRGGAGVVYDWIAWNYYTNGVPIQRQDILFSPSAACSGSFGPPAAWCATSTGFLANGGMKINFVPPSTQAAARAQTSQMMADAKSPKVFSWSLEVQREIFTNTSLAVRYLGTRALELPVQFFLNSITAFENGARPLPTYIRATDIPATVPATAPTQAQFGALRGFRYAPQGFTGGPVAVALPIGASTYHGGAVELLHRFDRGLLLRANYTFSKTMDDSTVDLGTSVVNPRRPENPYNLRNEWARSALDVSHKVAITFLYDTPRFTMANRFADRALNGWTLSGSYLFQSGQPVTIQSGVDSNGNLDSAVADRAILNPSGVEGVGSLVTPVCRDTGTGATSINPACLSANIVGYAAVNSNAKYIQAGPGALSNLGRNTFNSPYFNVWNLAVLRNAHLTERFGLQLRLEAYNVFNHPDFTLGSLSVFPTQNTNALNPGYASLTGITSGAFLNPRIFSGGGRRLELGVKITY